MLIGVIYTLLDLKIFFEQEKNFLIKKKIYFLSLFRFFYNFLSNTYKNMDIQKFKDSNIFKSNNRRDRKNEYHSKINELEELEKSLNFVAIETRYWR